MSLLPENVIIVYREGDTDSLSLAQYYASANGLGPSQMVPVSCSSAEFLPSYAAFQTQVEMPLLTAIADEYGMVVKAIVLGYNVPGGFMDGSDVISSTSRLARINQTYSKKTANQIFDRRVYQDYDAADADASLIVSRIDGPSLAAAKAIVDAGRRASKQWKVNGSFFFDKDAVPVGVKETAYYNDLTDFETLILPVINMTVQKTVHWDEYTDVPLFRLVDDSFMWSWKSSRAGYSFFEYSTPIRVFLYNADTDGASSLRSQPANNSYPWCYVASQSGYALTAGATSDPGADGYLRPKPFFEALLRGTTVGEAFIYSVPYLDWSITLVGDPLVRVRMPTGQIASDVVTPLIAFDTMKDNVANALGYYTARANAFSEIRTLVLNDGSVDVTGQLGPVVIKAFSDSQATSANFQAPAASLFNFASPNTTADAFLTANSVKVSDALAAVSRAPVASSNLYVAGSWYVTGVIVHPVVEYLTYTFFIDVAYDSTFDNIIETSNSVSRALDWTYEKSQDSFVAVTVAGVTSSYTGRRIRYTGRTSLNIGTIYYARIRQKDNFNIFTDYQIIRGVINT